MIGIYQKNDVEHSGKSEILAEIRQNMPSKLQAYIEALEQRRAHRAEMSRRLARARPLARGNLQHWLLQAMERDRRDYLTSGNPEYAMLETLAKYNLVTLFRR